MRKLLLFCALVLLALPAATGAMTRSPGDGSLTVRGGQGAITLTFHGSLVGRFDSGILIVDDPSRNDGPPEQVWGQDRSRDVSDTRTIYAGQDVRFRMVDGTFRVRILRGVTYGLSVVGRGFALIDGNGPGSGAYSVNGADYRPVPSEPTKVFFGLLPVTPGG